MNDPPGFRELSRLTLLLKVGLGSSVALAAASLWSGWLEIDLLQRAAGGGSVSEVEAAANDSRQALLGGLELLVGVITCVMFLRWTYLSNRNARSLGAVGMHFTPGWAVGWYFIPIAHLWKPYLAMWETFKASHPDFTHDWEQAPTPRILPVWWALWLISSFLGQAVFRSGMRAETVDELLAASRITFASAALDIPLGLVAITVVAQLQALQTEKRRRLASATRHLPVSDGPPATSAPEPERLA